MLRGTTIHIVNAHTLYMETTAAVPSTLQIALCYFDLKDALVLDPDHAEARQIMTEFRQEADRCHTSAVQLALQKRHRDALHKISMAIEYDPTHAEFHNIRCDD